MSSATTLKGVARWLRDWWRGYSDADVESVVRKLRDNPYPGKIVPVTEREMKAAAMEPKAWFR